MLLDPFHARALELRTSGGLLQLPASSYHHLAYRLDLGIGKHDQWRFAAGLTHPAFRSGLRQVVGTFSLSHEWGLEGRGVRPFGALGIGAYLDQVGSSSGLVPALNLRGGIRIGGEHMGLSLELDSHVGVYSFSQTLSWVVWPLYQFLLGVYFAT